jgi:hypothetical protein
MHRSYFERSHEVNEAMYEFTELTFAWLSCVQSMDEKGIKNAVDALP